MPGVEEDSPAIVHTCPCSPGDRTPIVVGCEHALLGMLLRSESVEQAAMVLAAVADVDFANPWVRRAIGLAREVVGEGVVPVASVLLARLTTQEGRHQYQLMVDLVVAAWWAGPPPIAAWSLVAAVLESSYRRAACCWADRVRQASDGPLDVLIQVVSDYAPMRAVWRRLTSARRVSTRAAASAGTTAVAAPRRSSRDLGSSWEVRPA